MFLFRKTNTRYIPDTDFTSYCIVDATCRKNETQENTAGHNTRGRRWPDVPTKQAFLESFAYSASRHSTCRRTLTICEGQMSLGMTARGCMYLFCPYKFRIIHT